METMKSKPHELRALAHNYHIELIVLFGSTQRGNTHAESDIDIAVYGRHVLSENEKMSLIVEFARLFHTEKIDLVDIKNAPPLLRKKILDNYQTLFEEDPLLKYQLELTSIYELREADILFQMRRERVT